ncbi:MAG: AAA family ATPase, partial [Calditrichia bacterium]|nr:AAA family ATPase [Calditrichia bacterium]
MYLSKLTINGFKSFANRTQFDLIDGLTGIIGPNGCGKSNIVDAIRWVLGEQKVSSLRSDKMENVIFNGTNDRKPLGMAEVTLTIENNKHILPSEFTEVVIARRLFRSGESQYLLNNQPVRLKDIQNLFIDTGMSTDAYSIIELKMVELILSDNKEERRRLFEEAAGIKKYKMHRRSALRKLDLTQQELTRLTDIITEVKRSVNSLTRQVSKTKRYQELKEELRQKEIDAHVYKYQQYHKATGPLNNELKDIMSSKEKFAVQVTQKESELEKVKKVVLDIEREFQEIQRNLAKEQGQLQELEKENLVDKQRLEMLNREIDRSKQELATTRIRIEG